MGENSKEALINITAMTELDKNRFRGLLTEVKEAKRRADELLEQLNRKKDAFCAELLKQSEEVADKQQPVDEVPAQVVAEEPSAEVAPVQASATKPDVKTEEVSAEQPEANAEPEKAVVSENVAESKPAHNPLRPDVPEPRKFKPTVVYIPESERGIGRNANRNQGGFQARGPRPYGQNPAGGFGFGMADKDKPMFIAPQNGKGGKQGKKTFDRQTNNSNFEDKKTSNKKSILRRELENGSEIDDSEIARRFKSKKYQKQAPIVTQAVIEKAVINVDPVPIKLLSEKIGKPISDIIRKLLLEGIMKTINDSIDYETAELVAANYGIELELKADKTAEEKLEEMMSETGGEEEFLEKRAPIITIMGHVDHGKTSLLDYIRNAHVADKEAGGITQHIGAYTIEKNGEMLTFIDTPGHEAFTTMRARGAMVTDIAIIVIAADDGIMPQTVEAINHAKAANVPVIVAVNKMDKQGADLERVKVELSNNGLVIEEWGGDVICCPVSAKTGKGVDALLDSILLLAEVSNLRANKNLNARGTVIEAKLDKGSGPVATVLVQNGTLKVGDYMVAGSVCGRVKSMINDKAKLVKVAGPSTPVSVLGFDEVPSAGDKMLVVADEKLAKKIAEERKIKNKIDEDTGKPANLDDLFAQISEGKLKDLNLIVKADVQGSVEALVQELVKLSNDEVKVNVVHKGVGAINESDVVLANTSSAIIIGFNVRPDANAKTAATKYSVDIRNYRIIYDVINDITLAMKGLLAPKFRENVLGRAEVRDTFHISGVGTIAGCRVVEGKLEKNADLRLLRDGVVITENKVASLKRLKDDVKEVLAGFECGVGIEKYNDIKVGDVIECFVMEQIVD